jgi:hypothetical protein
MLYVGLPLAAAAGVQLASWRRAWILAQPNVTRLPSSLDVELRARFLVQDAVSKARAAARQRSDASATFGVELTYPTGVAAGDSELGIGSALYGDRRATTQHNGSGGMLLLGTAMATAGNSAASAMYVHPTPAARGAVPSVSSRARGRSGGGGHEMYVGSGGMSVHGGGGVSSSGGGGGAGCPVMHVTGPASPIRGARHYVGGHGSDPDAASPVSVASQLAPLRAKRAAVPAPYVGSVAGSVAGRRGVVHTLRSLAVGRVNTAAAGAGADATDAAAADLWEVTWNTMPPEARAAAIRPLIATTLAEVEALLKQAVLVLPTSSLLQVRAAMRATAVVRQRATRGPPPRSFDLRRACHPATAHARSALPANPDAVPLRPHTSATIPTRRCSWRGTTTCGRRRSWRWAT